MGGFFYTSLQPALQASGSGSGSREPHGGLLKPLKHLKPTKMGRSACFLLVLHALRLEEPIMGFPRFLNTLPPPGLQCWLQASVKKALSFPAAVHSWGLCHCHPLPGKKIPGCQLPKFGNHCSRAKGRFVKIVSGMRIHLWLILIVKKIN